MSGPNNRYSPSDKYYVPPSPPVYPTPMQGYPYPHPPVPPGQLTTGGQYYGKYPGSPEPPIVIPQNAPWGFPGSPNQQAPGEQYFWGHLSSLGPYSPGQQSAHWNSPSSPNQQTPGGQYFWGHPNSPGPQSPGGQSACGSPSPTLSNPASSQPPPSDLNSPKVKGNVNSTEGDENKMVQLGSNGRNIATTKGNKNVVIQSKGAKDFKGMLERLIRP